MSDDEEQSGSSEDDETTDVEMAEQTKASRRDFRPQRMLRGREDSHQSPLLHRMVNRGMLEAQTDELRARVQKTLADAERILTSPRMSMANAPDDRRERTRTANAVDSSNEVVFQLHPRPSLDEGHTSYAGRLGLESRSFGIERPVGAQDAGTAADRRQPPPPRRNLDISFIIVRGYHRERVSLFEGPYYFTPKEVDYAY